MTLREWKYQDILEISRLEAECFAGEKWSYQMFASEFSEHGFIGILAEEDGVLLGYCCVQCVMEDCDLKTIAVRKSERGRGLGKAILTEMLLRIKAQGVDKTFLEVRESNSSARALYEKAGFTVISRRKKYYPGGEDALVMMKVMDEGGKVL